MKKSRFIIFIPLLLFLLGCSEDSSESKSENDSDKENDIQGGGITMDQVSNHSSEEDCWFVIDEKVYNVTEYVSNHPGGKDILEGCGKDATELFNTRPSGSGTPHSSRAESLKEDYYIGDLKQ